MKRELKPFEKRLIDEYCELRDRHEALKSSLGNDDQLKETVGEFEYSLLTRQLEAMGRYLYILDTRIDDLKLRTYVPTVYGLLDNDDDNEFLDREAILRKAYTDCMEEMYLKSQPSASYNKYVEQYRKGELTDKDRIYERHYLSQDEYEYILDKYISAYGMDKKWNHYVDTVIEYLNDGAIKDKWIEDYTDEYGHHHGYRGYEKLDGIEKLFANIIENDKDKDVQDIAQELKKIVVDRIECCKNFYRFDREEGDFKASIALGASPSSNPETVKKYWKDKGVDVEITERDPNTLWERDYYGKNYDEYLDSIGDEDTDK